jgi:hypothetical protein
MRRLAHTIQVLRRGELGQSLVEFAIIAPVIVGILIFAIFFYEATQIKLKQQEAERYVVWEFTGKKITDYNSPGGNLGRFGAAQSEIVRDTRERYEGLISYSLNSNRRRYVMTSWAYSPPQIQHQRPPDVPGGFWMNVAFQLFKVAYTIWDAQTFTSVNPLHYALMTGSDTSPTFAGTGAIEAQFDAAKHWKFNTWGYVSSKMQWRIAPTTAFTQDLMDERFDNKRFRRFTSLELKDPASPNGLSLIVDHWNLQDGRSIWGNYRGDEGTAYWTQVNQMAFVTKTSRAIAESTWGPLRDILSVVTGMGQQLPLSVDRDGLNTALASIQYNGQPGKRYLNVDRGPGDFDTAPFSGAYRSSFESRGNNFMGCPEAGQLGCNGGLSQNNPFGDYVITGEGQ